MLGENSQRTSFHDVFNRPKTNSQICLLSIVPEQTKNKKPNTSMFTASQETAHLNISNATAHSRQPKALLYSMPNGPLVNAGSCRLEGRGYLKQVLRVWQSQPMAISAECVEHTVLEPHFSPETTDIFMRRLESCHPTCKPN